MPSIQSGSGGGRTCIASFISILLVAGAIMVVIYFVVILEGDVNNLPPEFWDMFDSSPPGSDQLTPEEVDKWENFGQGLSLTVVNALDEEWHSIFYTAISQWDAGYPDTLTLNTAMASEPNSQCEADFDSVMVCNGDYGNTGWKGIAEILSSSGVIKAATCRMNEYYLSSGDTDERQYAMCHELGHAWGLHHTDEQFNNQDLGNCLDYTNRPQNNLTPDITNYSFLHAMYGLVPGAEEFTAPTASPVVQQDETSTEQLSSGGDAEGGSSAQSGKDNNGNRALEDKLTQNSEMPDWLLESIRQARMDDTLDGRVELPGGYILSIHKILA